MEPDRTPFLHCEEHSFIYDSDVDEKFVDENVSSKTLGSQSSHVIGTAARITMFCLAVLTSLLAIAQIKNIINPPIDVYRPSTFPTDYNLCDCGSTIKEARAKGCKYDSMATAWLPKYCRDDELTAEFERSGPGPDGAWSYYADANGTIPITIEEISMLGEGERSFWAYRDWHLAHCLWYWEKYIRMRDTGAVMEMRFDRVTHTRHCRHLAMEPYPNHDLLIEVNVVMSSRVDDLPMKGHKDGQELS